GLDQYLQAAVDLDAVWRLQGQRARKREGNRRPAPLPAGQVDLHRNTLNQFSEDNRMAAVTTQLGFIGLGVVGEPMCRNLVQKSGARVMAYDRDPAPLERIREHGAQACAQLREAVQGTSVIFLSLPSGEVVRELALADRKSTRLNSSHVKISYAVF